jgi:hypothetical protein
MKSGPGSSVGIATDYGLDGPGIESQQGRDFPPVQTSHEAHPASCTMGTESFPGVKCGRGVLLTTHPLLATRFGRVELYPYPPLGHNRASNGVTLPAERRDLLSWGTKWFYKATINPCIKVSNISYVWRTVSYTCPLHLIKNTHS